MEWISAEYQPIADLQLQAIGIFVMTECLAGIAETIDVDQLNSPPKVAIHRYEIKTGYR